MLRVFKHFGGRSISDQGDQDEGAELSGEKEV